MISPPCRCTLVMMQDETREPNRTLRLALPVSVGLHAAIAALLIFGLPNSLETPQKEDAVAVKLVAPPKEQPKPKALPAPQKPPEPPKKQAEAAKPPPKQTPASQPIPRLNPVVQYGRKDAGPRRSLQGDSADAGGAAEADRREEAKRQEASAPEIMASPGGSTQAPPKHDEAKPKAEKSDAPKGGKTKKLKKARSLFSRSSTGDALAVTAMAGMPRSARGGTLCVSELSAQLTHADPPYFADLLPSYPLKDGNVIDVPRAAFRVGGKWRDLAYRCEVDADATKVLSFAFRVGDPIPPDEWQRRGLPVR